METYSQVNLQPAFALVIYKGKESDYTNQCYSELHPFVENKMGAGQPLTEESYDALVSLLKKGRKKKEVQNESSFQIQNGRTLLAFSQVNNSYRNLVWNIKPAIKQLLFAEDLKIPSGLAPHPTLIFRLAGREVSVFASEEEVPTGESKLYVPPYFNLSTQGKLCLGNAQLAFNLPGIDEQMKAVEAAFFNSYFTHAGDLYKKLDYSLVEFWKEQINSTKPFDMLKCLPTKLTLNDLF